MLLCKPISHSTCWHQSRDLVLLLPYSKQYREDEEAYLESGDSRRPLERGLTRSDDPDAYSEQPLGREDAANDWYDDERSLGDDRWGSQRTDDLTDEECHSQSLLPRARCTYMHVCHARARVT